MHWDTGIPKQETESGSTAHILGEGEEFDPFGEPQHWIAWHDEADPDAVWMMFDGIATDDMCANARDYAEFWPNHTIQVGASMWDDDKRMVIRHLIMASCEQSDAA